MTPTPGSRWRSNRDPSRVVVIVSPEKAYYNRDRAAFLVTDEKNGRKSVIRAEAFGTSRQTGFSEVTE